MLTTGDSHGVLSPAAGIAVEVFLQVMRNNRVRPYDIATRCRTLSVTRHVPVGPRQEIVRSFEIAPPFWPITVARPEALLTGFGIDRTGACISYTENPHPLTNRADSVKVERVQFSAGCHNLMRRATRTRPAVICERLSERQAGRVLAEYLIDATVSLSEGRGPVAP